MKRRKGIRKQLLSVMLSFSLVLGSISVHAGETLSVETERMTEQITEYAEQEAVEVTAAAVSETEAAEPTAEAGTEKAAEAAEPTVEAGTEQAAEAAVSTAEAGTEKVTEAVTESDAEKVIETVTESDAEKVIETVTESDAEKVTETETEKVTETVTETETEKVTEAVTESETEKVTETATEPATEKVTGAVTERETEKITEASEEASPEPETEASSELLTERITEAESSEIQETESKNQMTEAESYTETEADRAQMTEAVEEESELPAQTIPLGELTAQSSNRVLMAGNTVADYLTINLENKYAKYEDIVGKAPMTLTDINGKGNPEYTYIMTKGEDVIEVKQGAPIIFREGRSGSFTICVEITYDKWEDLPVDKQEALNPLRVPGTNKISYSENFYLSDSPYVDLPWVTYNSDVTYNGKEQTLVYVSEHTLQNGTISYTNQSVKNAGTYTVGVKVTLDQGYSASNRDISPLSWTESMVGNQKVYTQTREITIGKAALPVNVSAGGILVVPQTTRKSYSPEELIQASHSGVTSNIPYECTYTWEDGTDVRKTLTAGDYKIKAVITPQGDENQNNYAGTEKFITVKVVTAAVWSSYLEKEYNGNSQTLPADSINFSDEANYVYYPDYTIRYKKNGEDSVPQNAGDYDVYIEFAPYEFAGQHYYNGEKLATIKIKPATLKEGWLTLGQETFTYNGMEQTPTISLKGPDPITLIDVDYEVSYKDADGNAVNNPANAGTYTLVVTGKGNFTGTLESEFTKFTITPKELTLIPKEQIITYGSTISSEPKDVNAAVLADGDKITDVILSTDDKDVTENGIISIESVKITENGTDVAANYDITYQTGNLKIQPKRVTVAGITAVDKIYDASAEVMLDCSAAVFEGLVGTDTLSVTAAGTAADKHVGENKTVTIRDITLADGAGKASNYMVDTQNSQAETTVTMKPKQLTIDITVADKQYDGLETAVISKAELQGLMENDEVTLKNGAASFDDVDVAVDIPVRFTEFTIEGADAGNYVLTQPTGITADIYNTYDAEEYTVAPTDWTNETVTVTAAEGYLLSEENKDGSSWSETLTYSNETAKEGEKVTVYLRNAATNAISLHEEITYYIDKTSPTGTIELVDVKTWNDFSEDITFDDFYNEMKVIKITAEDALSGVASVEYYESASSMTLEEVKAIDAWEAYGDGVAVTLEDAKHFVYFARITDAAGNITYLSTDGSVYDTALPYVSGVTDGETYYTTQNVRISDYNLETVTLNGVEQTVRQETVDSARIGTADLVLEGDKDAVYEIIAKDKAGNVTTVKVTMKPIETLTEDMETVTDETLKPEDREKLEQIRENLRKVDISNATDDEKEVLKKAEDNCDDLIEILDRAQEEVYNGVKPVEDAKQDGISVTEKDSLKTEKENLESLLEKNEQYLPEAEKQKLQNEIADLNAVLDVIDKLGQAKTVIDQVKTESGKAAVPEHEEAVKAFEAAQEAYDKLSVEQKAMLGDDVKAIYAETESAVTAYKIIEGDGQSWTTGSENGLSFTANGLVDKFVSITVDGSIPDQDAYSVKAGSTVVTLKAGYLNTLKAGTHTIVVNYVDGASSAAEFAVTVPEAETEDSVGTDKNPETDTEDKEETDKKPETDTEDKEETDKKPETDTEDKEETDKKPETDTETEVKEDTNAKPEPDTEAGEADGTDSGAEDVSEAAKTGDDTNIWLWIFVMMLSGAAMLTILAKNLMKRRA